MSLPIRVGIVGPGAIAEAHARALLDCGAQLTVVAGTTASSAEDFGLRYGIPLVLDDPEFVLRSAQVDMLVISSPHAAHVEQARTALESGKHVLLEVPMAMNLVDAERLVSTAAAHGVRLGICQTLRFHESIMRAAAWMRQAHGPPSLIVARRLMYRLENIGWTGRARSWPDSLLWHHGAHVIDTIRFLTGLEFEVVGVAAGHRRGQGGEALDYAIALRSASGTAASVGLSYTSLEPVNDIVVMMADETLTVTPLASHLSSGPLAQEADGESLDRAVARQDAAFVKAVNEGSLFAAEGTDVLGTMGVLQQVQAWLE